MSVYSFAAALEVTSPLRVATPPPTRTRDTAESGLELSRLPHSLDIDTKAPYTGAMTPDIQTPHEAHNHNDTDAHTPVTPNELEATGSESWTNAQNLSDIVPSFSYPRMNKWRVLCACFTYFGNGLNDSAPGALLPYIEAHYRIDYVVVSMIFVTNAAGFIITAFGTDTLLAKLGRARTLMLGEVLMIVGYIIIVCTPPFPVVIVAYLFLGLGYALNLAINNVFCANLRGSTVVLGAAQGSYGIGGIVAPIIATLMVSHGILWSRFFFLAFGVRLMVLCGAPLIWRGYESEPTSQFSNSLEAVASRQRSELGEPTRWQLLKRAIRHKVTLSGALFIFAYQGAEVSISGWVISYLINYRGGVPAQVGYVTSGFWGGITVGRFVLSHAAPHVGERLFVYILVAGSIGLQLLVWFIPNVIGDAVAVALLGLLLGPIYPASQTIFSRLLPRDVQVSSISFISSAGSSGGAVAPFMTGLLAQTVGTYVLHPICIGLFSLMIGCWFSLPKVAKRSD